MAKFQPYSRRVWRRRFAAWARHNRRLMVGATAFVGISLVLEAVLFTVFVTPNGFSWWLLGVVQTSIVYATWHILYSAFLAHDREAIWHLRGAWGEENTRSELQRAKRKRLIWGWVDSISLQAGDLDHLVVTRRGGMVAIDSKWRNQANDTIDMAQAARRARTRAEGLTQSLLRGDRAARHRAKINPLRVIPVVVLWGAAHHQVPDQARVDGIEFVAGRGLLRWLGTLDGEPVDKRAAADVIARLEEYRASTQVTATSSRG
ncbi:hypothetical protein [Marmoricola sp. RAF53]|uniref:hypothetical protein n=1 Tax=Marmoricola sp. RAF53 TaxID=3233059 RepID=UPI003F9B6E4B